MPDAEIHSHYRDEPAKRKAFLDFVPQIFPGVSFSKWHALSLWPDRYIPFSLFIGEKLISNVSISHMDLLLDGKKKRGIQFSAVGTLPEYRNQGHSRRLMQFILDRYQEDTDIFFLFANDSVLDFYPKFGFETVEESLFSSSTSEFEPQPNFKHLHISHSPDWATLRRLSANRMPLTEIFGAADYDHILLWHVLNFDSIELRYLPEDDVLFLVEAEGETLHIYDIVYVEDISLSKLIAKILTDETRVLNFHFTASQLELDLKTGPYPGDSPLFIKSDSLANWELPPFKFPALAQT